MSQGRKELRRFQLARESAPGTRFATPRALWRGLAAVPEDTREVTKAEEQIGIFGGADRTYVPKLMGALEIEETEATFEQIGAVLTLHGLGTSGGDWAGSAQGASGSTAVQTLIVPTSSSAPYPTVTAEGGDDAWAEYSTYVVAEETTLSFAGGEAMKIQSTLAGRFVEPTNAVGSFSAAGTLYPAEVILAGKGSFWLTPATSGAAYASGLVTSGNILSGEIKVTTRWAYKFPVDSGTTYFHTAVFTGIDIEGELTLEQQISGTVGAAGSMGQVQKWRAEEAQLLTARWVGGAISAGTTYTVKTFEVRLPIKWDTFEALDDMDGNDIRKGAFTSKYNENVSAAGRGTFIVARRGTCEIMGGV